MSKAQTTKRARNPAPAGTIAIKRLPVAKIKAAKYNPRRTLTPDDPAYQKLAASIEQFGYVDPLIWNKRTGNLVGGHQRLSILIERGVRQVDVSVVDLDPIREKALNLSLNKVSGEWDEDALRLVLAELDESAAIDATLSGFDATEIDELIATAELQAAEELPDTSGCASAGVCIGDCLDELRKMPDESVHCVVTSPPYWALRDYGTGSWIGGSAKCDHKPKTSGHKSTLKGGTRHQDEAKVYKDVCGQCGAKRVDDQLGLEPTPEEHIARLLEVFREVRRVLRSDGTFWLNYGDSYAQAGGGTGEANSADSKKGISFRGRAYHNQKNPKSAVSGLKPKDMIGMPWRLALAMQEDGWYLRSDVIWAKANPMPEPVSGRPTKSHEHVFLFARSARYYYDAEAVREESAKSAEDLDRQRTQFASGTHHEDVDQTGRHLRDVWTIATQPTREDHYATFPEKLAEPCLRAGVPLECCPHCGAPPPEKLIEICLTASASTACCSICNTAWRRIIEVSGGAIGQGFHDHDGDIVKGGRIENRAAQDGTGNRRTKGFLPDCRCKRAPAVPGTVLDPFCGTGTTGVVAKKLGLSFIGIELNPKSAAIAARRIAAVAGPVAEDPAPHDRPTTRRRRASDKSAKTLSEASRKKTAARPKSKTKRVRSAS